MRFLSYFTCLLCFSSSVRACISRALCLIVSGAGGGDGGGGGGVSSILYVPVNIPCLRTAMLDELDFRKEAKNIENFTEFLDQADITDAVAPKVRYELPRHLSITGLYLLRLYVSPS